jgi:uncharacterized membrane protein
MNLNIGAAIAIFFGLFVAFFLCFLVSMMSGKAAQQRARARRMAEHKMNARLLRLDI